MLHEVRDNVSNVPPLFGQFDSILDNIHDFFQR